MANSKISALTSATTPLAGTEVLPIVQSSTTKQVAVSDLTAGRAVSMASATVSSGNLSFSTTGQRITGDFTNATLSNRLSFQSSTVNGNTDVQAIPNGTATTAQIIAIGGSDPDNAQRIVMMTNGGVDHRFTATYSGTPASGTYLPVTFYIGGVLRYTFDTSGNITPATAAKGINFTANTPAAGMTSQLLNWYEEGTWTPNQGAGLTLVGAFSSTGKYTRIGRQVSVSGTVAGATSVAVAAAGVVTSNLPFTVGTAGHGDATNTAVNASAAVICTGTSVTSAGGLLATGTITFSATYFV